MKIVFSVLHYCQPDVTIDCIESLLSLEGEKEIVVVDNASPDASGVLLQQKYETNSLVHVLINKENLGFAGGNNSGYKYAKEQLDPDIIVVMNNDTLIKDKKFITKLNDNSLNQFHIIAPDILTFKGMHQNPYKRRALTKREVKRNRIRKWLSLAFYSIPLLYKLKSIDEDNVQNAYVNERIENIVPHGSVVIFTRKWIEIENFAFYPGTFMYFEEDLLFLYIQSKGYKTIYEPRLQVVHLEDMSTNNAHRNFRKKMIFQNKKKLESYKVILNFMNSTKLS